MVHDVNTDDYINNLKKGNSNILVGLLFNSITIYSIFKRRINNRNYIGRSEM
jgi:hypothetical protein